MSHLICGCEASLNDSKLTLKNGLIEKNFDGIDSITVTRDDNHGCSAPFMQVCATSGKDTCNYQMWEDLPLVRMDRSNESYLLRIFGAHWVVRSVKLRAFTDDSDLLAEEKWEPLFRTGLQRSVEGELFFLEDNQTEEAIIILSEAPDYIHSKLSITQGKPRFKPGEDRGGGFISLSNGGNPVVIGFCKKGECAALCRNYYRHLNQRKNLVTMSNTWGDAHGRDCVCHDFVIKEIDMAEKLGVDIVQIDDGWQINGTVTTAPRNAEGFRDFSATDSWEINSERFPEGLRVITDYAAGKKILVGMWMVPYSWNEFETLERDIAVLRRAYDEWGIRFFKLDMYQVTSERGKQRLLDLIGAIYSFGDDVSVQMDVTRHDRLNYLSGAEFGTIFAENRYTMLANYFPHRVLRHQWTIGKYIPLSRFQFELVNPDRVTEYYNEGDPFVPSLYTMDYLFAAVMLSNPLFWMEMQFLNEQRCNELAPLMAVWKEHRKNLVKLDAVPIGEQPTGRSWTGFACREGENAKYLLVFREVNDRAEYRFEVAGLAADSKLCVLASNAAVDARAEQGALCVRFERARSYALVKIGE